MYSDERSWAGVLMKKVQAISIMIAAAMLFSISACGIPTGSGVPEPVARTLTIPLKRQIGKREKQIFKSYLFQKPVIRSIAWRNTLIPKRLFA